MAKRRQVSHKPRTLELLRQVGWLVDDCERRDGAKSVPDGKGGWRLLPGNRRDLFGIGDLCGIPWALADEFPKPQSCRPALVQICSSSTLAAHKRKIAENPDTARVLTAFEVVIITWAKQGSRWTARRHDLNGIGGCPPLAMWDAQTGFYKKSGGKWVHVVEKDLEF